MKRAESSIPNISVRQRLLWTLVPQHPPPFSVPPGPFPGGAPSRGSKPPDDGGRNAKEVLAEVHGIPHEPKVVPSGDGVRKADERVELSQESVFAAVTVPTSGLFGGFFGGGRGGQGRKEGMVINREESTSKSKKNTYIKNPPKYVDASISL